MDSRTITRRSRFLSLVLRHQPELIGIQPDAAGWVPVGSLLHALQASGNPLTPDELDEIVRISPKQRFAFSEDGRRIRANQGHSIDVALGLQPAEPPETLYHGTISAALVPILREGLQRQQRHHVHLSPDVETARLVGARRGSPVILEVAAARMHRSGFLFYRSANGVWLTEEVPPDFLRQQ